MTVLVTGAAGFIGSALCIDLLNNGEVVIGIDNHNNYYDPKLKEDRILRQINFKNYNHFRVDLNDKETLNSIFKKYKPSIVVNLAAQAGVRYSIENPVTCINSNILGFVNLLEICKNYSLKHFVYASSSSVYGSHHNTPFSSKNSVSHPLSIYAASKISNELISHVYSHINYIPTTGLRFFTVYGPWGRPDMALFKFTKSILNKEPIQVYNYGKHTRDFTYIDDIVGALTKVIYKPIENNFPLSIINQDHGKSNAPWRIYNIGSNYPVDLMRYITILEEALDSKAKINFLPIQPGDVPDTHADVGEIIRDFDYKPNTSIKLGVQKFVEWYKYYYNI